MFVFVVVKKKLLLHIRLITLVIANFLCHEMNVPGNNASFCSIIDQVLWFTGKTKKKGVGFVNGDGTTNGKY